MNESSKTLKLWSTEEKSLLSGDGIDIGCGNDPVTRTAIPFDVEHGDANYISKFVNKKFDFVYSSHCLEHMSNPESALKEWWSLVKPGGALIFIVPDEDLYEQGFFPSRFNQDHKFTFSISKYKSWSLNSINVIDLIKNLENHELIKLRLQDHNYDRAKQKWGKTLSLLSRLILKLSYHSFYKMGFSGIYEAILLQIHPDQTLSGALAQIEVFLRKK